jgi:hypothetical protein
MRNLQLPIGLFRDPKADLRRRLLTCTALVSVCAWAPLNAASAQVNVVANGVTVDLSSQPTYPNFNSLRAVNGGQIINTGPPPVTINLTNQQHGAFAQTNGTITLNGVNVFASDPTYIVNPIAGPRGLTAQGVGAVLNATNFNIDLNHTGSTPAQNGTGLRAVNGGILTATGGTVTMTGAWNHGIVASNGIVDTNAAIIVNGGATGQTFGAFAEGISQPGPWSIILRPGSSITNHHGMNGYGALAQNGGRILLLGGSVTTTGTSGYGLYSFATGSLIVADAAFEGVQTSGNTAYGARAIGGGFIELNGTTILTTGAALMEYLPKHLAG